MFPITFESDRFLFSNASVCTNLSAKGLGFCILDRRQETSSPDENLKWVLEENPKATWAYQAPDEYRLDQLFLKLSSQLGVPSRR